MRNSVSPASPHRVRRAILASLLAASTLAVTASAQAGDQEFTRVDGSGGGVLQFDGYEGDAVNFSIQGHTTEQDSPVSVTGTFEVTHTRADGTAFAEISGSLDCMWVAGDVAVATGIVEHYNLPGIPGVDLGGRRVGFTIDDHGRHDRIGWTWAVTGLAQDVPPCMSTAPFFELQQGQFQVHD